LVSDALDHQEPLSSQPVELHVRRTRIPKEAIAMRTTFLAHIVLLLCATSASAQKFGDRIIVIAEKAELKWRNKSVGSVPEGDILTVYEANNDSFRVIYSDGRATLKGWISRRDAIPVAEAVKHFGERLQRSPDANLHNILGKIGNDMGTNDLAEYWFSKAIELDPSQSEPWRNRARARLKLGKYDDAVADCDEAIRLDPKNAYAYVTRAVAWSKKGELDREMADYDEAIRLDPKGPVAFNDRGMLWEAKGEYDSAISDYSEAMRLDPEYTTPYRNRGITWGKKGNCENAVADFNEALGLNPAWRDAYYDRAHAYFRLAEYEKSIADFRFSLLHSSGNLDALRSLAMIFAACPNEVYRDGKEAVKLATKACRLNDWKDADLLEALAAAYAESGDFENAIRWQTKALEMTRKKGQVGSRARLSLYKSGRPYRIEARQGLPGSTLAQ
jgi:tetratricopeptide (TPR) repeat protein